MNQSSPDVADFDAVMDFTQTETLMSGACPGEHLERGSSMAPSPELPVFLESLLGLNGSGAYGYGRSACSQIVVLSTVRQ
jgi:hypothetical protein